VPVVPVLFAILLLEFMALTSELAFAIPDALAADVAAAMRHAGGRVTFAAAVALHTGVCLGAMIYFWLILRRIAPLDWGRIVMAMAAMALCVFGLMILLSQVSPRLVVFQMTYFTISALLEASPLASDLIASTLPGGVQPLSVAALYPTVLGIFSVLLAAGVTCAVLRRIGPPHAEGWAASFRANVRIILRSFYVLSLVLVSSSLTALLFVQLPAGLVPTTMAPPGFAAALASYTGSLATFWGGVYTLTLVSVFIGPMAVLYTRAWRHVSDHTDGHDLTAWLTDHGLNTSFPENIKNMIFLLAPLFVGPIGDLTKALG